MSERTTEEAKETAIEILERHWDEVAFDIECELEGEGTDEDPRTVGEVTFTLKAEKGV